MTKSENVEEPLDCVWMELDRPKDWQSASKSNATKEELKRRGQARRAGMKMPLDAKIAYAHGVIDRAMEKDVKWYIAFSAGNDSHVLSHMAVHTFGLNIPHVMSNTRLEYPQTYRNLKRWKQWLDSHGVTLHMALPDKRPHEVWAENGIPLFSKEIANKYVQWIRTGNDAHLKKVPAYLHEKFRLLRDAGIKLTDKCCDELKKKPMKKLVKSLGFTGAMTGTRMEESNARQLAYIQQGSLYHSTRNNQWIANPLSHWLESDIAEYQSRHGIELEKIPSESGRSGCVNCGFGCHLAQQQGTRNSLQTLHDINHAMWSKTMDEWGFREACEIAGIDIK